MRNGQLLVFDEMITASATAYTSTVHYDRLGSHDELAIIAVIDNVSAAGIGFDLFIEHSCDARNWLQRNDTTQASPPPGAPGTGDIAYNGVIFTPLLTTNTTYARMFSDPCKGVSKVGAAAGPLLANVRFAMKLTSGSAHVKVHVVQRDL